MARKDPNKLAEKWARNTSGNIDSYKEGIQAVDEAPGIAAARHEETMKQRTMEALESGRWAQNTAAVSKEEWQRKALGKGAQNLQTGVREAKNDMAQGFSNLVDDYDRIRKEIRAMPNATEGERQARYQRGQELMKQLKGKFKKNRR